MRVYLYAAGFAVGLIVGWQVQSWRYGEELANIRADLARAREAAIDEARKIEAIRADNLVLAELLEHERNKEAEVIERVITEEVVRYVQTPGARAGGVDAGGVRLINAAAGGGVSKVGAAARPIDDADPSPGAVARAECHSGGGGVLGDPKLWHSPPVCEPAYLFAGLDHRGAEPGEN